MAKSSVTSKKPAPVGGAGGKKRPRKPVQVVVCPSAFPDFRTIDGSGGGGGDTSRSSSRGGRPSGKQGEKQVSGSSSGIDIDLEEAYREVHALGSTGFAGKQARKHKEAQYKAFTGMDLKKQKVPLPIVRGIKKKRAEREARAEVEAKEAGVVTSNNKSKKKAKAYSEERRKSDSMKMAYGPSPDVGYMQGGVLRVKKGKR